MLDYNMQLKTKVITSLMIFFTVWGCKEDRGYEVINMLSDSNNPTEQDIDSELGKRFSRSREDIETFNFYYKNTEGLESIVDEYDISIIKFRGLNKLMEFKLLNKDLPEQVFSYIGDNYPERVVELMDQNGLTGVMPYEIIPTYLYLKDTNSVYTFNIGSDTQLLDLLDLYRYYIYSDYELREILILFSSDFKSGRFYDSNFNAVLSNENVYLTKYRDLNLDFKKAEDILFIDMNGYISVDENDSDYFHDFLIHLSSFSSGDYLYRRANVVPLIKGYKVHKLTTNQQNIYKRVQSDDEIFIFSSSLMGQELKYGEVKLLKSFLLDEITIDEYLTLSSMNNTNR